MRHAGCDWQQPPRLRPVVFVLRRQGELPAPPSRSHSHDPDRITARRGSVWINPLVAATSQLAGIQCGSKLLAGVLLLTPLLHIAMDFGNNYGVHPFWPLDNRWFYGDSIFIIEPLFWAACAPLAFIFRTRPARFIVWLLMVAAIGLVFFIGMVPRPIAAIYS